MRQQQEREHALAHQQHLHYQQQQQQQHQLLLNAQRQSLRQQQQYHKQLQQQQHQQQQLQLQQQQQQLHNYHQHQYADQQISHEPSQTYSYNHIPDGYINEAVKGNNYSQNYLPSQPAQLPDRVSLFYGFFVHNIVIVLMNQQYGILRKPMDVLCTVANVARHRC